MRCHSPESCSRREEAFFGTAPFAGAILSIPRDEKPERDIHSRNDRSCRRR